MSDPAVNQLADLIVERMLDSVRLQQMIREITLRTLTEQCVIQQAGAARGFLAASFARGVAVWLDKAGELKIKGNLGPDLTAALIGCANAVVQHLRVERDIQERTEARMRERDAEQAKADRALWEEWRRHGGGDEPIRPASNGAATQTKGTT